jgi:apolipoprotein N-acyltransferase
MLLVLSLAAISGVLLWAAFFPLDLGPLGFVALVPWLMLVRAPVTRRRRYGAAYFGAFVFFALATNWVRVADPMMYFSWAGLSLVLPLFWVLGLDLIRRCDRLGVPLALSVPVTWVALEYVRMHFPTGFPFLKPLGMYQMIGFGWYFLGYTQHSFLRLIQIADLGGVYAVSFVVGAVNGLLADWMYRVPRVNALLRMPAQNPESAVDGRRIVSAATLGVVALTGASIAYGAQQLAHGPYRSGPVVSAIQGSVPQGQKMLKGNELQMSYARLFREAVTANPRPDLVVWPETCFPEDWIETAPGQTPPEDFDRQAHTCEKYFSSIVFGVPTLIGLTSLEWENGQTWKYNSALLLTGRGKKVGRYDKMHLVPFGEYVPLKEYFPFLQAFTPYKEDYSCRPGEHWTHFPLKAADQREYTFGCLICYEDSDPDLARRYVAGDEPVDFLVNISNDGWFDGTEEHEEHLAISCFRAIEARRTIVRSVNMGISAIIDPDGRVIVLPRDSWSASKKVDAVLSGEVLIASGRSLYSAIGDWVPAGCWAALAVVITLALLSRPENPV